MQTEVRTPEELENYRLHRRFDRMGRLIGDHKMKKLMESHVAVIGLGGVGSWAAESIVRSGVGKVTLVDFDSICITNFNRQLHSLHGLVGKSKSEVMEARMKAINPVVKVRALPLFYNAHNAETVFSETPDYVIDAIDNMTAKAHLIDYCKKRSIPLVTSTGSGGRMDPTQVRVLDLSFTEVDPLARELRKILRQKYGFPPDGQAFGVPSVFSAEPYTAPVELHYDGGKGFQCVCPQGDNPYFTCDNRNLIMGNASFVTGAFGLACAATAVQHLIRESGN
jgi:tRNA threonylcarbamoyladenosine dehydratase